MEAKKINPQYFLEKLKSANWEGKLPYYSSKFIELKINVRPNKSIAPGVFKPDPLIQNSWLAHPQTINALRKDIFMGSDFEELEIPYQCLSCKKNLDIQFWIHCPYCETQFVL